MNITDTYPGAPEAYPALRGIYILPDELEAALEALHGAVLCEMNNDSSNMADVHRRNVHAQARRVAEQYHAFKKGA